MKPIALIIKNNDYTNYLVIIFSSSFINVVDKY